MATGINEGTTTVLSNEDIVKQFCLQNMVNETAASEALKFVQMDDLSSDKIPRGQRRLILHIVHTLLVQDVTAVETTETTEDTNAGEEDGAAAFSVQIDQEGEPEPVVQHNQAKSNENADL